jgi:hypothetical protein
MLLKNISLKKENFSVRDPENKNIKLEEIPLYISNLISEFEHNVISKNLGRICANFQKQWNIHAPLLACACCGMRNYAMGIQTHQSVLVEKLYSLQCTPNFLDTMEKDLSKELR